MTMIAKRAVLIGLLTALAVGNAQEVVKIGTGADYPPWSFEKDGQLAGYDVDIINHICKTQNLECEITVHPWKTLIKSVRFKKFDVMFDGIAKTEARMRELAFSRTYGLSQASILTTGSNKLAKTCRNNCEKVVKVGELSPAQKKTVDKLYLAFKDAVIGTQVESVNFYYMTELFPEIKILTFDTMEDAVAAMVAGKVDAVTANSLQIRALANSVNDSMILPIRFEGGRLGKGAGFGFRKEEKNLIDVFNRGIDSMIESGKLKELSIKWFKTDISPPE